MYSLLLNLITRVQFLCLGFTGAPDSGTYSTGGITGPTYFVGSTGFTGPKGSMGATASNNIILLYLQEYLYVIIGMLCRQTSHQKRILYISK